MSDNKNEILLEELKEKCLKEINDELSINANNLVFGKGNPNSKIMFIGEAPGEKEDLQGIPFVGRAGLELDKMLRKINLSLDECYIANILKYRPPKNRDPNSKEILEHTPYLIEQIKIINPKILITLGNYSTKFVLADFKEENMKNVSGITNHRGKPKKINFKDGKNFIVFPIYHPAAMLYRPNLREVFEEDFKIVSNLINKKI